jgi:hypothetical protein
VSAQILPQDEVLGSLGLNDRLQLQLPNAADIVTLFHADSVDRMPFQLDDPDICYSLDFISKLSAPAVTVEVTSGNPHSPQCPERPEREFRRPPSRPYAATELIHVEEGQFDHTFTFNHFGPTVSGGGSGIDASGFS